MKIDPRIPYVGETQQPENVKNTRTSGAASQSASKPAGLAPAAGEDTVSLSSAHGEVQALTSAVANVPEVRSDRVAALQQQISKGQYQPSSQNIAEGIIKEYSKASQKA